MEKQIKENPPINEKMIRELENAQALENQKAEVAEKLEGAEQLLAEKVAEHSRVMAVAAGFTEAADRARNQLYEVNNKISEEKSEARTYENYKETLQRRKNQILQDQDEMEQFIRGNFKNCPFYEYGDEYKIYQIFILLDIKFIDIIIYCYGFSCINCFVN